MSELGDILVFKFKSYFTNKEVEAQRGCMVCPTPPCLEGVVWDSSPGLSAFPKPEPPLFSCPQLGSQFADSV